MLLDYKLGKENVIGFSGVWIVKGLKCEAVSLSVGWMLMFVAALFLRAWNLVLCWGLCVVDHLMVEVDVPDTGADSFAHQKLALFLAALLGDVFSRSWLSQASLSLASPHCTSLTSALYYTRSSAELPSLNVFLARAFCFISSLEAAVMKGLSYRYRWYICTNIKSLYN